MCSAFELFCLVNNSMMLKEKRKKLFTMAAGFYPRTSRLKKPHLTAKLPELTASLCVMKYVFISNVAFRTIRPSTYAIPQFQFLFKNLLKCIRKVVNISKSQYHEFRHNIINLGNQNSKYSWRIRDLENPQTGTHFRKIRLNV